MGARRDAARIDGLAAHDEPRRRWRTASASTGDVGGGRGAVYPVATMNQLLGTGDKDAWAATISKQNG